MSPTLLERPPVEAEILAAPRPELAAIDGEHPCEERRASGPVIPLRAIPKLLMKSYLSSFHFCLSELGWIPQRILEVGSGDGTMLSYLAQTFMEAEVVGVEFSAERVAHAQEKNCCRVQFMELSEVEQLPFESDSFDLVVSHGFLGRASLPHHWVAEMARVSAEAVILSAPVETPYRLTQHLPGAEQLKIAGQQVFQESVRPVTVAQLQYWFNRHGMALETRTMPLPFGMFLGRKPAAV